MDLCAAMHADQDQMLKILENYCCACSLTFLKLWLCMYRCRDLPVYHCFFECSGYLIYADTDRRLHHSINKTGFS